MSQSRRVEAFYDFLSPQYDSATQGKFAWTPPTIAAELMRSRVKSGSSALDIGVGTGQSIEFLLQLGCRVCGADLSQKMLDTAKSKFPTIETVKLDLNEGVQSLKGRKFDIVMAIGILEFVTDLGKVLKDLASLVAEKGFLCFTFEEWIEGHPLQSERMSLSGTGEITPGVSLEFYHHRYRIDEIIKMLELASIEPLETKRFQAYYKTQQMIPIEYGIVVGRLVNDFEL